jgi:hypothetical protein
MKKYSATNHFTASTCTVCTQQQEQLISRKKRADSRFIRASNYQYKTTDDEDSGDDNGI